MNSDLELGLCHSFSPERQPRYWEQGERGREREGGRERVGERGGREREGERGERGGGGACGEEREQTKRPNSRVLHVQTFRPFSFLVM